LGQDGSGIECLLMARKSFLDFAASFAGWY
jgi:hypothetical protein